MSTNHYDERQNGLRGAVSFHAFLAMMVLAYGTAALTQYWHDWATPMAVAHTIVVPALTYFTVRTILAGAYLQRGMRMRPMVIAMGALSAFFIVALVIGIGRDGLQEDGLLGTTWTMLLWAIWTTSLVVAGLLRLRADRRELAE